MALVTASLLGNYMYLYNPSQKVLFTLIDGEQAQDWGKIGVEFFSQLLELGYEKFPSNTTDFTLCI